MRNILVLIAVLTLSASAGAQSSQKATEKDLIGTWAGSWTGGSNGKFETTITKGADGKLGGTVSPTPDTGEPYTTPLNSVVFADGKATLKCFDPQGQVEITVEMTLEGISMMKGTYTVRNRADGSELETGNISAAKKPAK